MPVNSFLDYPMLWKPEREKLSRPVYLSLAEQLERDIAAEFLRPGTKLPPQRELADFLDINFTTVTRAYRLCELKGLLYGMTGRGTFVSPNAAESVTISTENLNHEKIDLGFVSSFEQCNEMLADTIVTVAGRRAVSELLDYSHPTGMPHHKAAGVNFLQGLGLHTDTEHLAVVSGTQNGLALSLLALFEPGNRIAVDTYTYANFIELAKFHHLQLVPIPGDAEGMFSEKLLAQHRHNPIQGVFLMPSCCNPTTIVISEKRKRDLAQVIEACGMILIEDDIHGFLHMGTNPEYGGPMAQLIPEHTVYLSGTSKPLCSGLRVAYMVFAEQFRERLLGAIFNVNVKTSSLDAEIITELILSGKAYEIMAKKQELAAETNSIFDRFFPDAVKGQPLSFYRWLPIRDGQSGMLLEQALASQGILVYHSDRFLSGARKEQCFLRVSLSAAGSMEQLETGLSVLRESIKSSGSGHRKKYRHI